MRRREVDCADDRGASDDAREQGERVGLVAANPRQPVHEEVGARAQQRDGLQAVRGGFRADLRPPVLLGSLQLGVGPCAILRALAFVAPLELACPLHARRLELCDQGALALFEGLARKHRRTQQYLVVIGGHCQLLAPPPFRAVAARLAATHEVILVLRKHSDQPLDKLLDLGRWRPPARRRRRSRHGRRRSRHGGCAGTAALVRGDESGHGTAAVVDWSRVGRPVSRGVNARAAASAAHDDVREGLSQAGVDASATSAHVAATPRAPSLEPIPKDTHRISLQILLDASWLLLRW
jgi:hypothetical protein